MILHEMKYCSRRNATSPSDSPFVSPFVPSNAHGLILHAVQSLVLRTVSMNNWKAAQEMRRITHLLSLSTYSDFNLSWIVLAESIDTTLSKLDKYLVMIQNNFGKYLHTCYKNLSFLLFVYIQV